MKRDIQALADGTFDVLVLGGGITGAGVALDAALRLGAERAEAIADPIVAEAERIVGFLPR